ncbi:MAG: response regulator [Deltaproteobacteria bacterium]|nr:response regulator [Deltaproteobacteria bacterium]
MCQKPRVLVVADQELIREMIGRALGRAGYSCRCAEDGLVALQAAQERPYDLILADLTMPIADVLSFVSSLRCTTWNTSTPVLLISCHEPPQQTRLAQQHSIQGFLPKPFGLEELLCSVSEILALVRVRERTGA